MASHPGFSPAARATCIPSPSSSWYISSLYAPHCWLSNFRWHTIFKILKGCMVSIHTWTSLVEKYMGYVNTDWIVRFLQFATFTRLKHSGWRALSLINGIDFCAHRHIKLVSNKINWNHSVVEGSQLKMFSVYKSGYLLLKNSYVFSARYWSISRGIQICVFHSQIIALFCTLRTLFANDGYCLK